MTAQADKQTKRKPKTARPQKGVDRKELRAEINKRFSKSLDYLAR